MGSDCFAPFDVDLMYGQAGEVLVATLTVKRIVEATMKHARLSPVRGYDFEFLGQRVEVKTDRQMKDTGNFAFELEIDGKPGLLRYDPAEAPQYVAYVEVHSMSPPIGSGYQGRPMSGVVYWFTYPGLVAWVKRERDWKEELGEAWRIVNPLGDERGKVLLVPREEVLKGGQGRWCVGRWRFSFSRAVVKDEQMLANT